MLPEEEKEKIEAALVRMQSREVARKTKEREGDALRDWKKEEEKKVEGGKKKFYLKKSESEAYCSCREEKLMCVLGSCR